MFNNANQHINVYGDDIEVDYRGYEVQRDDFNTSFHPVLSSVCFEIPIIVLLKRAISFDCINTSYFSRLFCF